MAKWNESLSRQCQWGLCDECPDPDGEQCECQCHVPDLPKDMPNG